jgi:hypothetical protein
MGPSRPLSGKWRGGCDGFFSEVMSHVSGQWPTMVRTAQGREASVMSSNSRISSFLLHEAATDSEPATMYLMDPYLIALEINQGMDAIAERTNGHSWLSTCTIIVGSSRQSLIQIEKRVYIVKVRCDFPAWQVA